MKVIQKIIIWLFEKYAFDYWASLQEDEARQSVKKRYDLKTDEDIDQAMLDDQQRPYKEAFDAGVDFGIEKVMERPDKYL